MKTFALSVSTDQFDDNAPFEIVDTVEVIGTNDHMHDWKWAFSQFQSKHPSVMSGFGTGAVSIHIVTRLKRGELL